MRSLQRNFQRFAFGQRPCNESNQHLNTNLIHYSMLNISIISHLRTQCTLFIAECIISETNTHTQFFALTTLSIEIICINMCFATVSISAIISFHSTHKHGRWWISLKCNVANQFLYTNSSRIIEYCPSVRPFVYFPNENFKKRRKKTTNQVISVWASIQIAVSKAANSIVTDSQSLFCFRPFQNEHCFCYELLYASYSTKEKQLFANGIFDRFTTRRSKFRSAGKLSQKQNVLLC